MKFRLTFLLALSCTLLPLSADIIYPDGTRPQVEPYAIKKIARGLTNIATFVFEIPRTIWEVGEEKGITSFDQLSLGLLTRGPYRAGMRLASGFYDLGTVNEPNTTFMHLEPETIDLMQVLPTTGTLFRSGPMSGNGDYLSTGFY